MSSGLPVRGLWVLDHMKQGFAAGEPRMTDADTLVRDPGEGVDNRGAIPA